MWEIARSLAAHATKTDPSEEGGYGSAGGGGSEESSSFKQQIEIPLAVSFGVAVFMLHFVSCFLTLVLLVCYYLFFYVYLQPGADKSCCCCTCGCLLGSTAAAQQSRLAERPCKTSCVRALPVSLTPPHSCGVSRFAYRRDRRAVYTNMRRIIREIEKLNNT